MTGEPGDLAVSPHRVLQRDLDDDRADPVTRGRRPRTADLVTGVVARAVVVVRARGQADGPAEPGHRQAMRDAQLLELSETPSLAGRRA